MQRELIKDLAEQIRGVSYKPEDLHKDLNEDSVILLRANNIDNGMINFDDVVYVDKSKVSQDQYLKTGDILICASSGSKQLVGKAASIEFDKPCTFGAFCKVVRPRNGWEKYLGAFFQSDIYRQRISALSIGANINNIRNEHIDSLVIPLHTEELRKSAIKEIDLLNRIIRKRKTMLQSLDLLIKARFVEMFGDFESNSKQLEIETLGQLGFWSSGGTPSRSNPDYFTGDINWYSAGELNSLFLDESVEKITKEAINNSAAKLFKAGSMLVGMYDTAAFKMGILKEDSASNQACACIEPNERVDIVWLYYALTMMKNHYLSQRRGVRQKNLNLGMIKGFKLPIAQKNEQLTFVSFVKQIDKSKVAIQKSLAETQLLFDKLMQDYFG